MHEDYLKEIVGYRRRLININNEDEWYEEYDRLCEYQKNYMKKYLDEYKNKVQCKAQEYIYELIEHIVYQSTSGNSIVFVNTKEEADEVNNIIWEEIGEMLLDPPEIYEQNGVWAIDCIFGGAFVPEWDGFEYHGE